jgi:hypothetical protein
MKHRLLALSIYLISGIVAGDILSGRALHGPPHFGYDPTSSNQGQAEVDATSGYRELSKLLSRKSALLLEDHLGDSYWTKTVAPIIMDSIYAAVVPTQSGDIQLRSTFAILDTTRNRLAANGQRELGKLSSKSLPNLPLVGNVFTDLVKAPNLTFSRGTAHYNLRLRKRVAPEFRLGTFSLCGGVETFLNDRSFSRKSVALLRYHGLGNSCRVQLSGKTVRFDAAFVPVDLRLVWNPRVLQFHLDLNLGNL